MSNIFRLVISNTNTKQQHSFTVTIPANLCLPLPSLL